MFHHSAGRVVGMIAPFLLVVEAAWAQKACAPYDPTEAGATIENVWKAQFERHDYEFTVLFPRSAP